MIVYKGDMGCFWRAGNTLFLDLVDFYVSVHFMIIYYSVYLCFMYFSMCYIFHNTNFLSKRRWSTTLFCDVIYPFLLPNFSKFCYIASCW